jgi:nucleoside-diphosphate-sugar epimerase
MKQLFCFGLGYSAGRIAERLMAQGWAISGTVRNPESVEKLRTKGYRAYVFDGGLGAGAQSDEILAALATATHVLLSIPPDAEGDPALRAFGKAMEGSATLAWIGYFSTVGVYGDAEGDWVDEETEARPVSERGKRRLAAEQAWLALGGRGNKIVTVFRLPGIYGPGKSAVESLKNGSARRIIKPGQVFNRIHVEDIAAAVIAAIEKAQTSRVYNVTDDEPGPPQDVVAYGAELLGLPIPPGLDFATANLTPMARSFYSESKRVSNARMKKELGIALQFPTYREGLRDAAARYQSGAGH